MAQSWRRIVIRFGLCIGLVLILGSTEVRSQTEPPPGWGTLTWYKSTAETVLGNSRGMMEPVLTIEERAIARSIYYNVTAQPGIGAFATWQDDRRVVIITAGIVQIMEFLSEAIIFDEQLGAHGCFSEYSQYVGERVIGNTQRKAQGLSPLIMVNLMGFSQQTKGACARINQQAFRSRPDLGAYRAKMIEASIVFLYLHELAHHVLGHTDGIRSGSNTSLAMHRDQEDAADRWAITHALRAHYNLIAAMPIFSFIALTGGDSIESEKKMDHPLGIRRVLALYQEEGQFYRQHPGEWKSPPSLSDFLHDMDETRTAIELQIAGLSRSTNTDSSSPPPAPISSHGWTACRNQCDATRDGCIAECGPGPDRTNNPNWLNCRRSCREQARPCRNACSTGDSSSDPDE